MPRRSEAKRNEGGLYYKVHYVYILQSINFPEHFYIGYTINLEKRLNEHNKGQSIHTSKYRPWKIRTCLRFDNRKRAEEFEAYLKTSSGRAFTKKRL